MKVFVWDNLSPPEKIKSLSRPEQSKNENIRAQVNTIIDQVKLDGDRALFELTKEHDKVSLKDFLVSGDEIKSAFNKVSDEAKKAIEFAKTQVNTIHANQLPKNQVLSPCEGVFYERQARPIDKVGLYVPGGSAPLVSTVLMLGVPAQIAGCPIAILCTPPNIRGEIDPHLLVAAELCGIKSIYKLGGAHAIAAMAYGTETIPKVDKLFGPGNQWVTYAKMFVAQDLQGACIDVPAGPSEVMVIADDTACPDYVAADLLSQAEHGSNSQVMLITLSMAFALQVELAVEQQLKNLPRKNIIMQALEHSKSIIVTTMEKAIEISNTYAPEHLILQVNTPEKYITSIMNAGAVFLGPYTPETLGDYVTGSNHVLPTYGYARNHSGLSVTDFMKFISFQKVTRLGLIKIGPYAEILADIEGLKAHKQAVALRLLAEVINE